MATIRRSGLWAVGALIVLSLVFVLVLAYIVSVQMTGTFPPTRKALSAVGQPTVVTLTGPEMVTEIAEGVRELVATATPTSTATTVMQATATQVPPTIAPTIAPTKAAPTRNPTATRTSAPTAAPATPTTTVEALVPQTGATQVAPTLSAVDQAVEGRTTFKFHFPNASSASGDGWSVEGLPSKPEGNQLVVSGIFRNTLGLGTQGWLAEPGTKLVGPDYPVVKITAEAGATEYISPVTQQFITAAGQSVPVDEDRFTFCTFGSANVEVNGVAINLAYQPGRVWGVVIRGLFGDQRQDTDRNHTLKFLTVPEGHAQCMNYPANRGGFISEGNYLQVVAKAHGDGENCGDGGCHRWDGLFIDLNTGAWSLIHQDQTNAAWQWVASNWFQP